MGGHLELLQYGLNLCPRSDKGLLLKLAAQHGRVSVLEFLLVGKSGLTQEILAVALELSFGQRQPALVEILLPGLVLTQTVRERLLHGCLKIFRQHPEVLRRLLPAKPLNPDFLGYLLVEVAERQAPPLVAMVLELGPIEPCYVARAEAEAQALGNVAVVELLQSIPCN